MHIRNCFLDLPYCCRAITLLFFLLFLQKFSVSVSYKVVSYMQDSTVFLNIGGLLL